MGELTLVHNPGDEPLPGIHDQRTSAPPDDLTYLVIRPTPQATGARSLIRDTMRALGKDPHTLPAGAHRDLWRLVWAWMRAHGVRHVVVDRAHLLTGEQIRALVELDYDLMLIWSASRAPRSLPLGQGRQMRVLGTYAFAMTLGSFLSHSPEPAAHHPTLDVPDLPQVDFPRFRAACRDRLAPAAFARVDQVYRAAHAHTLEWERTVRGTGDFHTLLTAHLRDDLVGDLVDSRLVLVRVRATQAALLRAGWLLRWNTTRLGPDPAAALRAHLGRFHARRLYRHHRTDHVAATVLALHLDQPPRFFDTLTCQDVDFTGALRWRHTPTVPNYPPRYSARPRRAPRFPSRCASTTAPSTPNSPAPCACPSTPACSWPPIGPTATSREPSTPTRSSSTPTASATPGTGTPSRSCWPGYARSAATWGPTDPGCAPCETTTAPSRPAWAGGCATAACP
ncbi:MULTISPECIES: hypothetical protein [Nocardiopsis]|uniref:Uncharacterized protein n=1 Tax=Nocardiopsis sinuspersici TaxID=501010 RepID=A0A1V3BVQ5_9ACTN|nr:MULTISPECIES: hypothetical protein [Nocardiopsis]OOC52443.1 hypothetical protein NOSIN_00160 [Nocardiopsis sinuspersici]